MALERQVHLLRVHPAAVVDNFDQFEPAGVEPDPNRTAPASSEFSTSSLSALAGRSTTSPAAIRLISSGGSLLIDMLRVLSQSRRAGEALFFKEIQTAFNGA